MVFHGPQVNPGANMSYITRRSFSELPRLTIPILSTAEHFVLGVCRCWDAFMDGADPTLAPRQLAPVFGYMNVTGALCAFDRLFAALHGQSRPALRFHNTEALQVGVDEARLLSGLSHLQRGCARDTIEVLRQALSREQLLTVLAPLARIAAILDARGHRLPAWSDAPHPTRGAAHRSRIDQPYAGIRVNGRNFFPAAIPSATNMSNSTPCATLKAGSD
jgi:hypothetical protein